MDSHLPTITMNTSTLAWLGRVVASDRETARVQCPTAAFEA